jgi:hypothetical protein
MSEAEVEEEIQEEVPNRAREVEEDIEEEVLNRAREIVRAEVRSFHFLQVVGRSRIVCPGISISP